MAQAGGARGINGVWPTWSPSPSPPAGLVPRLATLKSVGFGSAGWYWPVCPKRHFVSQTGASVRNDLQTGGLNLYLSLEQNLETSAVWLRLGCSASRRLSRRLGSFAHVWLSTHIGWLTVKLILYITRLHYSLSPELKVPASPKSLFSLISSQAVQYFFPDVPGGMSVFGCRLTWHRPGF